MNNVSDTDQMLLSETGTTRPQDARLFLPRRDLKDVPLLTQPNLEPQTQTNPTGHREDSASRTPSREAEYVVPPRSLPDRTFSVVLQKWEGFVLEIGKETFTARLAPLVGDGGDQIAEIYRDEIDDQDQQLLEPGAVFYWSIGYLDKPSGRQRFSLIRLRRLPIWSATELRAAEKKAAELGEVLDGAIVQ